LVLFIAALVVEENKPKKIDWKESYTSFDKIPYGCHIIKELLPDIFPGRRIKISREPIYNLKTNERDINYILINNNINIDEVETQRLLDMAENGSHIFISAYNISGFLADTLKIKTSLLWDNYEKFKYVNFSNPRIKLHKPLHLSKDLTQTHFASFDTAHTILLGVCMDEDQKEYANFIKIPKGEGAFYISTFPQAFTNYGILEEKDSHYLAGMLSYLSDFPIYWDEYYKAGKIIITSPLRYILQQEAFRWAYYILIFSLLIYVLFRAKRTQRIIPVVTPLKNTSIEFVRTIGKMYFEKGDHKNIADKKITYFLDYLRTAYHEKNIVFSKQFYQIISEKSAIALKEIENLFFYIEKIQKSNAVSEHQLNILNTLIEKFHQKTLR
jgi:hypothetical protein